MINANISNINHSILQASSSQSVKTNPYASSNARPAESPSSIVTISPQAQLANIGSKYDVTNISQNEMGGMVSELVDNELISSTDSLYLMAPRSMNLDPEVKFDLLASTRKTLAFAKKQGTSAEDIKNSERVVDILEKLQELFPKA
ncbi:MAG: hypothetical protein GQ475_04820 [Methylococcaceae bacterium]|nr:hypothetical protein [Methylococcaceae bacterium]